VRPPGRRRVPSESSEPPAKKTNVEGQNVPADVDDVFMPGSCRNFSSIISSIIVATFSFSTFATIIVATFFS
jgi:hypothetical protein